MEDDLGLLGDDLIEMEKSLELMEDDLGLMEDDLLKLLITLGSFCTDPALVSDDCPAFRTSCPTM